MNTIRFREAKRNPHRDYRWDELPDLACKTMEVNGNLVDWVDLPKSNEVQEAMIAACNRCPVLRQCRIDYLSHKSWTDYGIRAGIKGKGIAPLPVILPEFVTVAVPED